MFTFDQTVQIQVVRNHQWVAECCWVADSFLGRLCGLLGKSELQEGGGLLLTHCREIHTWWMKIPIDVVFVRSENKSYFVSSLYLGVNPWRLLPLRDWKAKDTLELPIGTIQRCDLRLGDQLCIN